MIVSGPDKVKFGWLAFRARGQNTQKPKKPPPPKGPLETATGEQRRWSQKTPTACKKTITTPTGTRNFSNKSQDR